MKVKELIDKLKEYNQEDIVQVIDRFEGYSENCDIEDAYDNEIYPLEIIPEIKKSKIITTITEQKTYTCERCGYQTTKEIKECPACNDGHGYGSYINKKE